MADLQTITRKINEAGMIPGFHIHYNKAAKDDPYVSPLPDGRLNLIRRFTLAGSIEEKATVIPVDEIPEGCTWEEGQRFLKFRLSQNWSIRNTIRSLNMKHTLSTMALLTLVLFAHCQKEEEKQTIVPMIVKNYEGHIHIGFWGYDKNMQISFYPCGVNQLFAIAKVCYYSTLGDHKQEHAANEFRSSTDWIGPYYVCSITSVNEGIAQKFTGGWHGSNGDGTGNPTASTIETRFVIDGKDASGNFEHPCNQVDLYVTNLIHGYDYAKTNAALLKESVHYTIKPNRQIDVEVRIEAIDDAVIQRYYGLQSQNFSIFDQVSYVAGQQVINTSPIKADSNCKTNEGVNTILLTGSKTQHRLRVVLNIAEGLGLPHNLGDGKPKAFSASYGKSYFNLVNGKDLSLKKGEQVFWKGSYLWD